MRKKRQLSVLLQLAALLGFLANSTLVRIIGEVEDSWMFPASIATVLLVQFCILVKDLHERL